MFDQVGVDGDGYPILDDPFGRYPQEVDDLFTRLRAQADAMADEVWRSYQRHQRPAQIGTDADGWPVYGY